MRSANITRGHRRAVEVTEGLLRSHADVSIKYRAVIII